MFVLDGVACSVAVRGRDEDVLPVWGLSMPAAISNALAAILEHGGIEVNLMLDNLLPSISEVNSMLESN